MACGVYCWVPVDGMLMACGVYCWVPVDGMLMAWMAC